MRRKEEGSEQGFDEERPCVLTALGEDTGEETSRARQRGERMRVRVVELIRGGGRGPGNEQI